MQAAKTADAPIIALPGRVTLSETFGHLFRDRNDVLEYFDRTYSVNKMVSSLQKTAYSNEIPMYL